MHLLKARTRHGTIAGTLALLVILTGGSTLAFAAQRLDGNRRPLAVSVPSEAVPMAPGTTGTIPVRVANPGSTRIAVRVASRKVEFGDDGRVSVAGRDSIWGARVDFPRHPLTIPAHGYRTVEATVRVPAGISPDLYFIGFVVTPIPIAKSSLTYINQIGSYLTIDVPGPRMRELAADLQLPTFALSGDVRGTLRVRNVGKAAAVFWGENDTISTPGSSNPSQERIGASLLPIGRTRTLVVRIKPSFLFATVTVRVHIVYPGLTNARTKEIVLTKRVLVVEPAGVALLAAALTAVLTGYLLHRRRRRLQTRRRRTARGVPRKSEPRRRTARKPASVNAATRVDRRLAELRASQEG